MAVRLRSILFCITFGLVTTLIATVLYISPYSHHNEQSIPAEGNSLSIQNLLPLTDLFCTLWNSSLSSVVVCALVPFAGIHVNDKQDDYFAIRCYIRIS